MNGYSSDFSRALGARGWIGMTFPLEHGGSARTAFERYIVIEELLAAGAPVALHWFADRQVGPALLRHGSPNQRQRYLPQIARGECFFAIGMSEPESGSDLAAVRTRAQKVPGGWNLEGAKIWTSHAHLADYVLVLARTDAHEGSDRHTGLSQFLVGLHLDGVEVRPIVTMDGEHHLNEVTFHGVHLDNDSLLGVRGRGWAQVMEELAMERSGPERFLSTMPLLRSLLARVPERPPALGLLLSELRSIREMSMRVAAAVGRGEVPTVEAAVVKDLGSQFERKVVELARAMHPVMPDLTSSDNHARLLAEALIHGPDRTLRGGTNEILRGIVARTAVTA
jgi:alkylation response protein AidB-like acyl-CoA dehydrogenase